jgi:hypothetical protein
MSEDKKVSEAGTGAVVDSKPNIQDLLLKLRKKINSSSDDIKAKANTTNANTATIKKVQDIVGEGALNTFNNNHLPGLQVGEIINALEAKEAEDKK